MPLNIYESGASPRITIQASHGNILIQGNESSGVHVDTTAKVEVSHQTIDHLAFGEFDQDCRLQVPAKSQVTLVDVAGNVSINNVSGAADIVKCSGNLTAQRVGAVAARYVSGAVFASDISNNLRLGLVQGNVSLKDINCIPHIGHIEGCLFGNNMPLGIRATRIDNLVRVRTHVNPRAVYRFNIIGKSAILRVPRRVQIQFTVHYAEHLHIDECLLVDSECSGESNTPETGANNAMVAVDKVETFEAYRWRRIDLERDFAPAFSQAVDQELAETYLRRDRHIIWLEAALRESYRETVRAYVDQHLAAAQEWAAEALATASRQSGYIAFDKGDTPEREEAVQAESFESPAEVLTAVKNHNLSVDEARRILYGKESDKT